jgi:hypothetical protein
VARGDALAFSVGFLCGYNTAHDEMAAAWSAAAGPVRVVLAQPLYAVLQAQRNQPRTEPCRRCDGASSCCVRLAAVLRNRERLGTDEYPGQWWEAPR